MNQFLKDNIAIVAAIVLPLILTVFFVLSTFLNNVTVADPKHDFVVASNYYPDSTTFQINAVNNRVQITYMPPRKDANGYTLNNNTPRLWRVHVPEMRIEEIALVVPESKSETKIGIPGLTDVQISNLTPGPDGYTYIESYDRYDNNLMTEIFSTGRSRSYRNVMAITKDGRVVPVRGPTDGNWYSYNSRFIGWIIEKE